MRISRVATSLPDVPYLMGESLYRSPGQTSSRLDVSVVMPCLNEEESVGSSVREAFRGIRDAGLVGEVIVVDNGSTDDSAARARAAGARVVWEDQRGYGNACRRGLREARGRIVVLGDCDGTYDFGNIPRFIEAMSDDVDVVMGNRLNPTMEKSAMPWLHRHIGNPGLTAVLNLLFAAGVSDAHCGLRAIRREALAKVELHSPGMEFASEFVLEAAIKKLAIAEIPISYRRRFGGVPKLRTFRDGWRHVGLMVSRRVAPGVSMSGASPEVSSANALP